MRSNLIETIMGAVVLAVAGLFLAFAVSRTEFATAQGYRIEATFASTGGLEPGSDVRVNGVKVGSVLEQKLDPVTYDAVVVMVIDPGVRLPEDTVASISGDGLLGGKYVRLEPGRAEAFVQAGGKLTQTKDYKSLEEMVGEIIFMATGDGGGAGAGGGGGFGAGLPAPSIE